MTPAAPPPPPLPEREDERLSALHRYRILDTGSEVDFDDVAALAATLTDCPVALVSLVDEGRAWFKARVGLDVDQAPRELAFCSWAVAAPGAPLQVPDLREDRRFASNPLVTGEDGFRSYAGVPLMSSDGHALGTVCVLDRQQRALTDEQVEGLQRLSRTVMSHIEARRVAEALLSVTEVLDAVRGLQHAADLEQVGAEASGLLARVLQAQPGELRLADGPCTQLPASVELTTSAFPASGTELTLPLVRDGVTLGVLTTSWPWRVTSLDPTVERVLDVLAHETAYAVSAHQDRRLLQVAAETDPLTGLANRRAGEARLRSWPRACIALVDLDHFKLVNDTRGHAAGDAVLRQTAVALSRHARRGDLVCRWGGEEFLVALAEGPVEALDALLARVRSELLEQSGSTFSAGIAVRHPGTSVRETLELADQALYAAKDDGRARTVVADQPPSPLPLLPRQRPDGAAPALPRS